MPDDDTSTQAQGRFYWPVFLPVFWPLFDVNRHRDPNMNNFTKHRLSLVCAVPLAVLSACGGGSSSDEFPVNEEFAAALVSKGVPEDIARYFAATKLSSSCPSSTRCTYRYTYPNGATRDVT